MFVAYLSFGCCFGVGGFCVFSLWGFVSCNLGCRFRVCLNVLVLRCMFYCYCLGFFVLDWVACGGYGGVKLLLSGSRACNLGFLVRNWGSRVEVLCLVTDLL